MKNLFKNIVCDVFVNLVRYHVRDCETCRNGMGGIIKEFPILGMMVKQKDIDNFFMKENENAYSATSGKR